MLGLIETVLMWYVGMDEYLPISRTGQQMTPDGLGWMIVNSLDTLILMNLTSRVTHAREWIGTSLQYAQDVEVNTFDTTVSMLGGLLSAHFLTQTYPDLAPQDNADEDLFIEKATDLASRLIGAFDSNSGVPYSRVNLESRSAVSEDNEPSLTSEAASTGLEWKYLAKLLGEKLYWEISERATQVVDDNGAEDGLVPSSIDPVSGDFMRPGVSIGSGGGAYYESILKQYLLTQKQEPLYKSMWDQALSGMRKHLLTFSTEAQLTLLGERPLGLDKDLVPRMEHRACFLPAAIALGATEGLTVLEARKSAQWGSQQEGELHLARELTKTCWGMAQAMDSGLAPEAVMLSVPEEPLSEGDGPLTSANIDWTSRGAAWRTDYNIVHRDNNVEDSGSAQHRQRPELVESLFYMYRLTGNNLYRDWAWTLFTSWVDHSMVSSGAFASLRNADAVPAQRRDKMEAWWTAGTLKYLYLMFSDDDLLPLTQVVFNSGAHVFPVFAPRGALQTGWKRKERDELGRVVEVMWEPPSEDGEDEGDEHEHEHEEEQRHVKKQHRVEEVIDGETVVVVYEEDSGSDGSRARHRDPGPDGASEQDDSAVSDTDEDEEEEVYVEEIVEEEDRQPEFDGEEEWSWSPHDLL